MIREGSPFTPVIPTRTHVIPSPARTTPIHSRTTHVIPAHTHVIPAKAGIYPPVRRASTRHPLFCLPMKRSETTV